MASTFPLLLGVWSHLSRHRRIQLGLLLIAMLASALSELLALGAVIPFLAVLSDPGILWERPLVQELAGRVGLASAHELILPATLGFATAAVFASLVRLFSLWLSGQLAAAIGSDLSCEAYRNTLYQPYSDHVKRNSATVISGVTGQIGNTVSGLNAVLQLISSAVVALSLITGLLLIDPLIAVAASALFGFSYWLLAIITRRELHLNGHIISNAQAQQLKAVQEGLGAIRDVLLDGSQDIYMEIYARADRPQRKIQAKNTFLITFPRYVLEALAMVAIAVLGGVLVGQLGAGPSVIPLLGAIALGAQRLLPALQQSFYGWATLKGNNASIEAVLAMLNQVRPSQVGVFEPMALRECITFDGVHFRYDSEKPDVLSGLDLEICRGERIGLIGSTGSGKSTMADLLMGLLKPTSGRILVDGLDLHDASHSERLLAWRASIAHVPQSIFLADSSIAENIAFGVPRNEIDLARVKRAAEQARIADFIESNPEGYAGCVGERGIRLSGGQRQRIGIARALYKEAAIIVFDEATSALDIHTEKLVMETVEGLGRELTIVIIAHRLGTMKGCDRLIQLDKGSFTASVSAKPI